MRGRTMLILPVQQPGAAAITEDVFHYWLNLARLCCVSYGEKSLTDARWTYMKQLEQARQQRQMAK